MFAIAFATFVAYLLPLAVMVIGGYVASMALSQLGWHLVTRNLTDSIEFGKGMGLAGAGLMLGLWVWIFRTQLHDVLMLLV